jgi:hypothetical protein
MPELGRNVCVSLLAIMAAVIFFHLGFVANYLGFENLAFVIFSLIAKKLDFDPEQIAGINLPL